MLSFDVTVDIWSLLVVGVLLRRPGIREFIGAGVRKRSVKLPNCGPQAALWWRAASIELLLPSNPRQAKGESSMARRSRYLRYGFLALVVVLLGGASAGAADASHSGHGTGHHR